MIDTAIRQCNGAVFIISHNSVKSSQVEQELYLANSLQSPCYKLYPVLIESISLEGSFRYVLSNKQFIYLTPGTPLEENVSLNAITQMNISDSQDEAAPSTLCSVRDLTSILMIGAERFYDVYQSILCDTNMDKNILPNVIDHNEWLGNIEATSLISSAEMMRTHDNWNCLYIGKSGFGKTSSLFSLMQLHLQSHNNIPVFYIRMDGLNAINPENVIYEYVKNII